MPNPLQSYTTGVVAPVALVTNTETVVATLSGINLPNGNGRIQLTGVAVVTSGTTTTAVVVRIRRGTLTGTLVSDGTGQTVVTAAGDSNAYPVTGNDSQDAGMGYSYVLTVQNTGGGTGGTTVYATLSALVS